MNNYTLLGRYVAGPELKVEFTQPSATMANKYAKAILPIIANQQYKNWTLWEGQTKLIAEYELQYEFLVKESPPL